jgi:HemK-related putative methylase
MRWDTLESGLRRAVTRSWLRFRHQILGRRYHRLVLEKVDNVPLVILPEVFNPVLMRTGAFLARTIRRLTGSDGNAARRDPRALDVGTGSGIGAIFAALNGYAVVGVDINPEAVRCARINVILNNLEERIEIRRGDLFASVEGERFDLVLFNPPFHHGTPSGPLDLAWRSTDVMERFAQDLGTVLCPGGEALVVLSTDGQTDRMLAALGANGFTTRVVSSRDFGNEVLTVYSARSTES